MPGAAAAAAEEGEPSAARQQLLERAIAYVAEHGVADLSLRRLADGIGTSHRMLIYHFGSKEGLLVAVVRTVEAQQRKVLADFAADPSLTPLQAARRMWEHLADPALGPNERLFFEVYGQALMGRPHTAGFLDDVVDSWLEPAIASQRARGVPEERASALARLELAVTRGLLLDLLATGDRAGVDAAIDAYTELFDTWRAAATR